MPPNLGDYIKITDVPKRFVAGYSSLRKRRDDARVRGDDDTYQQFVVRDRDGTIYEQPLPTLIKTLRDDGKDPRWYVKLSWVVSQYQPRQSKSSLTNARSNAPEQPKATSNEQSDEQSSTAKAAAGDALSIHTNDGSPLVVSLREQIAILKGQNQVLKEQLTKSEVREDRARNDATEAQKRYYDTSQRLLPPGKLSWFQRLTGRTPSKSE